MLRLLTLLVCLVGLINCQICDIGWETSPDSDSCYYISNNDAISNADSVTKCAEKGSYLVSINNQPEQTFLDSNI